MTVLNYQVIAPLGVIYTFLMFNHPGPYWQFNSQERAPMKLTGKSSCEIGYI